MSDLSVLLLFILILSIIYLFLGCNVAAIGGAILGGALVNMRDNKVIYGGVNGNAPVPNKAYALRGGHIVVDGVNMSIEFSQNFPPLFSPTVAGIRNVDYNANVELLYFLAIQLARKFPTSTIHIVWKNDNTHNYPFSAHSDYNIYLNAMYDYDYYGPAAYLATKTKYANATITDIAQRTAYINNINNIYTNKKFVDAFEYEEISSINWKRDYADEIVRLNNDTNHTASRIYESHKIKRLLTVYSAALQAARYNVYFHIALDTQLVDKVNNPHYILGRDDVLSMLLVNNSIHPNNINMEPSYLISMDFFKHEDIDGMYNTPAFTYFHAHNGAISADAIIDPRAIADAKYPANAVDARNFYHSIIGQLRAEYRHLGFSIIDETTYLRSDQALAYRCQDVVYVEIKNANENNTNRPTRYVYLPTKENINLRHPNEGALLRFTEYDNRLIAETKARLSDLENRKRKREEDAAAAIAAANAAASASDEAASATPANPATPSDAATPPATIDPSIISNKRAKLAATKEEMNAKIALLMAQEKLRKKSS